MKNALQSQNKSKSTSESKDTKVLNDPNGSLIKTAQRTRINKTRELKLIKAQRTNGSLGGCTSQKLH